MLGGARSANRPDCRLTTRQSRGFLLMKALVGLLLASLVLLARAQAACDVDTDGDIDRDDLGLIQRAILTRAAAIGPSDPRDADGNGIINSLDGRFCALRCTRPGCATSNSPPSVSFTAPVAGASYLAPAVITLTASATDPDGTIARVEFFHGTTRIGSATTAPYTVTWDGVPAGSYSLSALATDGQGATTSSPARLVTVNPTNTPPTVSLTAPADGSVHALLATLTLSATASGIEVDTPITRVDFFHGSTLIGGSTTAPYTTTWTPTMPGTYSLTAIATDSAGGITNSAPRTVTVQGANQLPSVSLTSPVASQSFTAPANISLVAMASDVDGRIARVEFFQGSTAIGSAIVPPYGITWNNVPAGTYSLTARATDNLGATRNSTPVPITVTGGGPTILYLHGDHLGTPRVATNEANAVVWRNLPTTEPFGTALPEEDPDGDGRATVIHLRFPGQYFDRETMLHYNYFRDYDPLVGRYTQSDPIGLAGGINTYSYVAGNPISKIDPLGLTAIAFDPSTGTLRVDPELDGRSPYNMPASSGKPNCGCDASAKDRGPIPSGSYTLHTSQLSNPGRIGDILRNMRGDWGDWRAPLTPDPGTNTLDRSGFFLHGGSYPGSAGCIDVGGGVFGNSQTDQLLRDILSDPDGRVPVIVK